MTHILRIPKGQPLGKVYYTVQSELNPVSFRRRAHAELFKKLLAVSVNPLKSDIVRREITDDGYIPTYGDRK